MALNANACISLKPDLNSDISSNLNNSSLPNNNFCPSVYSVYGFPHITVAAQNCNSLNISTECDKQLSKIIAITSLCTSIIFLSDIRMGGSAEHYKK
jgi:hypothetical protein